jgi:hypothetical protein
MRDEGGMSKFSSNDASNTQHNVRLESVENAWVWLNSDNGNRFSK